MEPGLIMYFLQDYLFQSAITNKDIKIFNKIFLKADILFMQIVILKHKLKD